MNKIFSTVCGVVALAFFTLGLTGCAGAGLFGGNKQGGTRTLAEYSSSYETSTTVTSTPRKYGGYWGGRIPVGASSLSATPERESYSYSSSGPNNWSSRSAGTYSSSWEQVDSCGKREIISTVTTHKSESSGKTEPPKVYYNTVGGGTKDGNPGIQPVYVEGSFGLGKPGKK